VLKNFVKSVFFDKKITTNFLVIMVKLILKVKPLEMIHILTPAIKKLLAIILVIAFLSCKTQKIKNNSFSEEEELYVLAFKKEVLYSCINEKTNREFYRFLDNYNDLGLYTEVAILYHDIADKASSFGKKYSKNIKPVNYPDAENKVPIFRDCVNYAFGKEIDSIARITYKETR